MFIRRSRYDSLVKECEGHLNEIDVLRRELDKSLKKNEKQGKSIDVLYSEAKIAAATIAKKATEVKEMNKDTQRLEQLKKDIKTTQFDLTEYMNPEPIDPEQRALYVSRIAGYFNGGLTDYIKFLLSNFKAEIARFPLSERETDFHRAGINLCYLLNEWGDGMINEQHANARGESGEDTVDTFDSTPEEDEAVENIKSSVNKE